MIFQTLIMIQVKNHEKLLKEVQLAVIPFARGKCNCSRIGIQIYFPALYQIRNRIQYNF